MFVQDQTGKVLFNMLHYKIKKIDTSLLLFDKTDKFLGILAEYKTPEFTTIIFEQIIKNIKHAHMNKIFCVYSTPSIEHDVKEQANNG